MHVVAAVEFLHKSILVDFFIFLVSEQGMRAVSIRLYFFLSFFLKGTQKVQSIHLIQTAYLIQDMKSSGNLPILV